MTIVRCPRCRDEVSVPAGASREALVRCPLCLEQYRLAEALTGVPPALVVIADERGGVAEGDAAEPEYAFSAEQPPDRLFEAGPALGAAVSPARPGVRGASRPQRKERSIVVELTKVVLGGVVGLSLGLLVLWWGFGRDPVDLGPTVARYAPWIVPEKLQGKSSPNGQLHSDGEPVVQDSGGPSSPATGEGGGLQLGSRFNDALRQGSGPQPSGGLQAELPDPFAEPARPPASPRDDGSRLELSIDNPLEVTRPASAEIELPPLELPFDDTAVPLPAPPAPDLDAGVPQVETAPPDEPVTRPPMPDLTDLLPDEPTSPPAADEPRPTNEPTSAGEPPLATGEELARQVAAADRSLDRYDDTPRDDKDARQQAFTELYLAASSTGRVVSHLSTSDPDLAEPLASVRSLLAAIAGVPGKLTAVKFLADQQWPARKHDEGLLVAGVVKEIQSAGPMFQITLDASVRSSTLSIPVVTAFDPSDTAAIGDELLVLGRVIVEPQTNLPGYEGDAERVLLYGYSVKVPTQR